MGGPLQTKYRKEELDTSLGQEVKNPFFGVQTMETSLWAFAGLGWHRKAQQAGGALSRLTGVERCTIVHSGLRDSHLGPLFLLFGHQSVYICGLFLILTH